MPIPALARRLYEAFQAVIHEIAKFGVVGVVNFGLDAGVFNLLHFGPPGLGPLTSKALSTVLAATSSYFMNRHWTWRHRARTGLAREYRLFILLSAIALGMTEACLGFSHYVLGLHSVLAENISANGVGLVIGMVFRFWSFRRWVFLPQPETALPAPSELAA